MEEVENESENQKLQEEIEFVSKVAYQNLKEKIERLRCQINSPITLKLPDKGNKMLRSLKICEDELHRRDQLQPTKESAGYLQEAECESSPQCQSSCSAVPSQVPGQKSAFTLNIDATETVPNQFPETPSSQAHSQNLEEKLSIRASINSCQRELHFSGGLNHQNTMYNGPFFNKGRRETRASSRQSPFQWQNNSRVDGSEHGAPVAAPNAVDSSNFHATHHNGNFNHHTSDWPRRSDMRYPGHHNGHIKRILRSIVCEPYTSRPQSQFPTNYQANFGRLTNNNEGQITEVLTSVHVMQQQFQQTTQTQLASLASLVTLQTQLASFESKVTAQIDRLETKIEQIIRDQAS